MSNHEIGLRIAFTIYSMDPGAFEGVSLTQYTNEIIAACERGYEAVSKLTGLDAEQLRQIAEQFPVHL